jgi:hypothetical protein
MADNASARLPSRGMSSRPAGKIDPFDLRIAVTLVTRLALPFPIIRTLLP